MHTHAFFVREEPLSIRRVAARSARPSKHTFAVGMEQSGASISTIGDRLGHSNYKVTADYLKRLHDDENPYGDTLEDL